jgi:hypothetical protein
MFNRLSIEKIVNKLDYRLQKIILKGISDFDGFDEKKPGQLFVTVDSIGTFFVTFALYDDIISGNGSFF